MGSNKQVVLSRIKAVSKMVPTQDVVEVFTMFLDAKKSNDATRVDIAKIESNTRLLALKIEKNYDIYNSVFGAIFSERKEAINKYFEVIDQGLKTNNNELISTGVHGLGAIVTVSPFASLRDLSDLLNSDEIIEL
jgi:hypothetical protein